ncbi:hypothetical protein LTR56_013091 [Elasticomyces elasticus]|nr:hypothetical protein LTR56_013091 [Elasticomyces elasticus]KAK3640270.1 hypothetical protein LTR22_017105 [Elasticomyces elasticus]KAK4920547.1 hypothetical protein LTR49_011962 [Elasticomyces elasticus]KAK5758953.1 hypothetical protein LTS12_010894 [Elasticomyces elasticus]
MDRKRPHPDDRSRPQQPHKKPKHSSPPRHQSSRHENNNDNNHYTTAVSQLPPPTQTFPPIPPYTPFTVPASLPPLPEITDPALAAAPFTHKSTSSTYNRSTTTSSASETTYEKLEFLGDAQLELLASRLLYSHFPNLTAGQLSQLRELLVKNETLAEYARAYGFDKRVQVAEMERMMAVASEKNGPGNKGFNKVMGDVFEAYVAGVVLSNGEEGWNICEKWMTALWAPKLVEAAGRERYWTPGLAVLHDDGKDVDQSKIYNPAAKGELQKKLLGGSGVKLDYEKVRESVELKGDQLGQNRHFIGVYLTGYGYTKKLLGTGEGKNKVEAGNWAAQEAMYGENKSIVDECSKQMEAIKEQRRKEREEKEAKAAAVKGEGDGKEGNGK